MPRALTNKQLMVLSVVREYPDGLTAQRVADLVTERTPCPNGCEGRERDFCEPVECRKCYDRGTVMMMYGAAYQALQRLLRDGLVTRDDVRDPWGDSVGRHVYFPVEQPDPDDPLERAFRAPDAEVNR